MSYRGSFITEYIYCTFCYQRLITMLSDPALQRKYNISLYNTGSDDRGIIAGNISSLDNFGIRHIFLDELHRLMSAEICARDSVSLCFFDEDAGTIVNIRGGS